MLSTLLPVLSQQRRQWNISVCRNSCNMRRQWVAVTLWDGGRGVNRNNSASTALWWLQSDILTQLAAAPQPVDVRPTPEICHFAVGHPDSIQLAIQRIRNYHTFRGAGRGQPRTTSATVARPVAFISVEGRPRFNRKPAADQAGDDEENKTVAHGGTTLVTRVVESTKHDAELR